MNIIGKLQWKWQWIYNTQILLNKCSLYLLIPLREKCSNTEFFLVRVFLYLDLIQKNTDQTNLRIWTFFKKCSISSFYKRNLDVFTYTHGNNILKQCKILVHASFTKIKVGLDCYWGSEFSSYKIELRNQVKQNDVTLRVSNSTL